MPSQRQSKLFILDENIGLNRFTPIVLADLRVMKKAKNVMYWGGRRSRGGSVKINSTAMSESSVVKTVRSMFEFTKGSTVNIVVYGGINLYTLDLSDGSLDSITGSCTFAADSLVDAVPFNGNLVITDGTNKLKQWTGTGNATEITDTTPNGIKFLAVNDNRVFGIGKSGDEHRLYWCKSLDATDWTTAGNAGSQLVYPESGGNVTGLFSDMNKIFVVKEKAVYMVDTTPYALSNWKTYEISLGLGGLSHRTIKKYGNMTTLMSRRGLISLDHIVNRAFATYTDPLLDDWLAVSKANATKWSALIDPSRGWYIFGDENNNITVYDVSKNTIIGEWDSIKCSSLLATQDASKNDLFLAGGSDGFIRKFNVLSLYNDDSSPIISEFETANVPLVIGEDNKVYEITLCNIGVFYTPVTTSCNLLIDISLDGFVSSIKSIALASSGGILNTTFIMNQSSLGAGDMNFSQTEAEGQGKYLKLGFRNTQLNQAFKINAFLVEYLLSGEV